MKLNSKKYGAASYGDDKKKKNLIKISAIVICSILAVVLFYQLVVMKYYSITIRNKTIQEVMKDQGNYIQVYKLNKDLKRGSTIKKEDLELVTDSTNKVPDNCIKDISKIINEKQVLRVDLSKKSTITENVLVNIEEDITNIVKNQDFNWIKVHSFLKQGDYVDIHYKQLDGTDTVVAAKKKITNLNGSIFAINISETERIYINNATVKADVEGGSLYTTIYPEPENQEAAAVTYELDAVIQEKIKADPNIVKESAEKIKNQNNNINNNKTNNTTINANEKPSFSDTTK